jgi:hypothetical protein
LMMTIIAKGHPVVRWDPCFGKGISMPAATATVADQVVTCIVAWDYWATYHSVTARSALVYHTRHCVWLALL